MKLILIHHESDGYTYSCENVYAVEYESEEKLLCDILDWAEKHKIDCDNFLDTSIQSSDIFSEYFDSNIEIMTLEKWWEINVQGESCVH